MSINVITFGCRLNSFESEIIKKYIDKYNLNEYLFINTCAVTQESERQVKQKIRQSKRNNPSIKIVVTGCMAQMFHKKLSEMQEVDFVIGNEEKLQEQTYAALKDNTLSRVTVSSQNKTKQDLNPQIIDKFDNRIRAFVQIQNGCSNNCSYCIITKARGSNRSIPIQQVVEQVRVLAEEYPEIILTGVNIGEYGNDLEQNPDLSMLIRRILNQVPDLKFLGISSLSPGDFSEDLIDIIVKEERILPYIHLSIQSGDNGVLLEMNRSKYTREDCIKLVHTIKTKRPDVMVGCDIIVGFPGEYDEQYNNTKNLLKEAGIDFLHVFPFSKRPGTAANYMDNQIDRTVAKTRVHDLMLQMEEHLNQIMQKYIGHEISFIPETLRQGKALNYLPIISQSDLKIGKLTKKIVIGIKDNQMLVE